MIGETSSLCSLIEISGNSSKIIQLKKMIRQVSLTDVNVLITGESGTGKEVAGRLIHSLSNRKQKPFVPVNCGAIPTELLESELFGHEKGAFTGAITSRIGRFELAHGGTIFLDEIGDMPLAMQVKILRVIQEKEFERVGSNKSIKVDVRIIAATHRDLDEEISQGRFREDLYYRLNVFPIEIPSVRERIEDLPEIVIDLVSKLKNELGIGIHLTEKAMNSLKGCQWNGNIRELSNLLERLIVLYPNETIDEEHLPEKYRQVSTSSLPAPTTITLETPLQPQDMSTGVNLREMLNSIELKFIKEALLATNGVVSHAAEKLGMRRTTLIEKMRKYNI